MVVSCQYTTKTRTINHSETAFNQQDIQLNFQKITNQKIHLPLIADSITSNTNLMQVDLRYNSLFYENHENAVIFLLQPDSINTIIDIYRGTDDSIRFKLPPPTNSYNPRKYIFMIDLIML